MPARTNKDTFSKLNALIIEVRKTGAVSMGRACQILNVMPYTVKYNYAPMIADLYQEVLWDGKHFSIKPAEPPKVTSPAKLDGFIVNGIVQPVKKT